MFSLMEFALRNFCLNSNRICELVKCISYALSEIQSCLDAHAYISTVSTIQWMPFGKHQSLNRTRWIRSAECFLATSCYVALLCCSCCVFPPDRTGRAPLVFLQFFNLKFFNPLKRLRETDLPLFENFF